MNVLNQFVLAYARAGGFAMGPTVAWNFSCVHLPSMEKRTQSAPRNIAARSDK